MTNKRCCLSATKPPGGHHIHQRFHHVASQTPSHQEQAALGAVLGGDASKRSPDAEKREGAGGDAAGGYDDFLGESFVEEFGRRVTRRAVINIDKF
ncbi:hypothetical protein [Streptomyces sp. NPDC007117]|uniref:hypothetical protein n=1 Tax=Streptomyces sp. NPDC007117 TaxID=3154314 RepID=UPI0033FA0FA4